MLAEYNAIVCKLNFIKLRSYHCESSIYTPLIYGINECKWLPKLLLLGINQEPR